LAYLPCLIVHHCCDSTRASKVDDQLRAMKIALFIPTLGGGGAERVILTLAEAFIQHGLKVDVVVSTTRGAYGALRADMPAGARLVDLDTSRLIRSARPLAAYLHRERPDSVLSADAEANCIAVCARALSRARPRLVLSQHTAMSMAAANDPAVRKQWLPFFCRWTYPRADAVVAVSAGVADDLAATIRFPRQRVQVIYNPVITSAMLAKSHEPLEHPWFKPGEPPVVLGVGRLTRQKDFPTLIRAFAILRRQRAARLVILGEGEERRALTDLIEELRIAQDAALPGFVHNPFSYMRAASVFALSSRWEGFGNVVAEALACGTRVVSTDCRSGPAEILEDGKWGTLVPVGEPDALAVAINDALAGPSRAATPSYVSERFAVPHIATEYLDTLRSHIYTNY